MYGKMQESGLIEIISLLMHLNYLGPVSCFSSILNFPQCMTSGATAVVDGIMATTSFVYWNGRWHSLSTVPPIGHNQRLQGILWPILSTVLGRLILRSGKNSVYRPLNVLIFGLSPVYNLKLSRSPVLLVYYELGNVFPCCFFLYLQLHYYNYSM